MAEIPQRRVSSGLGFSAPVSVQDAAASRCIQELQEALVRLAQEQAVPVETMDDSPVAVDGVVLEAGNNVRVERRGPNRYVIHGEAVAGEGLRIERVRALPPLVPTGGRARLVHWLGSEEGGSGDNQVWIGYPGRERYVPMGGVLTLLDGVP